MKKIRVAFIAIIAVLAACTVQAFGQAANDSAQSTKIFIDAKGGIHNHGGTKLGYITKDDIVFNNKGQKLYFIDRNGNVIDAKGNKPGMAKKNGNYYNNNGQVVLQLKNKGEETCAILDPKGHNMGTTHKNYKLHACSTHCFFLQQKKDKEDMAKM